MHIFNLQYMRQMLSSLSGFAAFLAVGLIVVPVNASALSIAAPDCSIGAHQDYYVVRHLAGGSYIADVRTNDGGVLVEQVSFLLPKGRKQVIVSKGTSALDPWATPVIRDIEGMVASANTYTLQDVAQSLSYSGVETEVVKMPKELVSCLRGLN